MPKEYLARGFAIGGLALLLGSGCAGPSTAIQSEEVQLGQLSLAQKRPVILADHAVEVGEANVARQQQALATSKAFVSTAETDRSVAQKEAEGAKDELEYGRKRNDPQVIQRANVRLTLTSQAVLASQVKLDYARASEAYHARELEAREAQLRLAKLETEEIKAATLLHNGMKPDVNLAELNQGLERERTNVADANRLARDAREVYRLRETDFMAQARQLERARRQARLMPPLGAPPIAPRAPLPEIESPVIEAPPPRIPSIPAPPSAPPPSEPSSPSIIVPDCTSCPGE